jgi:alpha-D-xyloside xylohydrolase
LRVHGYQTATELWNWLPETQRILLEYDRLRYRMLPYNYTMGARVTLNADTIMRALCIDFPGDAAVWNIPDEYMFGPAFLVAPVTVAKATSRSVYLPAGVNWVNFWTGEAEAGGREITAAAPLEILPLFVRAGSIVPLGPDIHFAMEKPADPIELRVYPGADGSFSLYEDEGDGYQYEKGVYATIPITWNDKTRKLTIGAREGRFPGMLKTRTFKIILVRSGTGVGSSLSEKADAVTHYDGTAETVAF